MLKRYTREEMGGIWTLENRFQTMLEVEKTVSKVQGELKLIPLQSAKIIEKKARVSLKNILKKEQSTRHDVTAFVEEAVQQIGPPHGRFFHWGLTSSDILDTALALQIKHSAKVLKNSFKVLKQRLREQAKKQANVLIAGRTHGQLAEPLTLGLKFLNHLKTLQRNEERFLRAVDSCLVGKLSGAVGAYSTLPQSLEKKVLKKLGLKVEPLATQIVPRDRHAELIFSLALTGAGLERLALEIRLLSLMGEAEESFLKGQTGSSAMPHKKNPIYSENITGLARLLRSFTAPALENIALWQERDISHSSVERVILPQAFILCDFALNRMAKVVKGLKINADKMKENMHIKKGFIFTSLLLAELVKKGCLRGKAYKLIQTLSHELKPGENLKDKVLKHKEVLKYLDSKEIKTIFSLEKRKKMMADRVYKNL